MRATLKQRFAAIVKAAVSPVSSFFGSNTGQLTKPVRSGLFGWLGEPFSGAWQRGVTVDPIATLTSFGAVYACISRIANDIAKLEPRPMQRQRDGTWLPAPDNSPHWLVLRRPNGFQNRIKFFAYWLTCKLLYGNAYALKLRNDDRGVMALYPLDPRRVTPMVTSDGDVYYSLGGDDLSKIPAGMVVPASEVIHDRMNCLWHPLVGVSPIYACAISATQGNRIQANSATFFENMSRPSGVLTAPAAISDETAARLKRTFEESFSGTKLGRMFVGGDGLKYEPMTIAAADAQLVDQLKWTVEDVARAFGMPLYKIGAGPMPTNNNVEALHQQYYADCLQTHIEDIELALDQGLDIPLGYRVEFDLDGLLRMDSATQIKMLAEAVGAAIMSPNEARLRRNLPPVVGGESPMAQQQNFSLAALAKRDARSDPFTSERSTSVRSEVADALDELIDAMPSEQRAHFLCAKDQRWVRKLLDDGRGDRG